MIVTAKSPKTVSLSHQIVSRRFSEMVDNISDTLHCVMNDCEFYSLVLDESTDITDVCQLITFDRKIDKSFEIKVKFLKLQPLSIGTKGSDVFEAINKFVSEITSFEKCTGIVTDGAKSMVGSKTGLVGHLKQ
jgi:actin-like ATPase involved in cell morphogenesis